MGDDNGILTGNERVGWTSTEMASGGYAVNNQYRSRVNIPPTCEKSREQRNLNTRYILVHPVTYYY